MKTKNKALVNYYARLIQKGQWKIEDVPDNLRENVTEALKALPPLETTPETESK